ncbi:MAG: hypothetical protein NW207_00300 [Cytophagales bacterium]|nr:hypothetical protein [Cytophagales bacterium]
MIINILTLFFLYNQAQDRPKYILFNNTNAVYEIQVSPDTQNWETISINAYSLYTFDRAAEKLYIKVNSNTKYGKNTLQYTIQKGSKYQIYWNTGKYYYDLSQY